MKLYSPAWIIVAGAIVVQGSGLLGAAGSAIVGLDNAIRSTIDIKKMISTVKIEPIKPVVVPPIAKKKKAAP